MKCSRCSSERSYQFEASPSARSRPTDSELPVMCRDCGLISIGGKPVALPEQLEQAARGMADAESLEVPKAVGEINEITEAEWVETYMSKFFRTAYLEGFFRALAFFRHDAKEGRLKRLRKLWGKLKIEGHGEGRFVHIEFDRDTYTEFEQLIHLGSSPGNIDVPSHPN